MAILIRLSNGAVIDEAEVSWQFIRAPGPGGQNVNKVASAVQLRFDLAGCRGLGEAAKRRAAALAGRRLTREGAILFDASRHRSQERNRADALARLTALLEAALKKPKYRVATRPTRGSQRRRLEGKRQRSDIKKLRGRPRTD